MGKSNILKGARKELSQEETFKLQTLRVDIQQNFKKEEIMWRQRVRFNWIKQGDLNTAFLHRSACTRNRKNVILRLASEGEIFEDEDHIRNLIHEHFKSIFGKKANHR